MALPKLTPTAKKIEIYSDLRSDFLMNPLTSDLALRTNEEAVKQSLKNLILTDRGERLFQPLIGSNIRQSLFDLMTPATAKIAEERIREVINNFEPRVTLISIDVKMLFDENKLEVTISFYVRNSQNPIEMTIFLERDR